MAYQVLYRKWRPKVFEDVAGQPQVTVTLKNELKSGRINHAYLFTGSRGTGKTTCAKILAKAINCLQPIDGDPCGECEICKGIDAGNVLDIAEIDAASNNGVDNIRSIIDEAAFTPAKAKYRVYIIDEVHMLSQGAFNALLKTLEEPPAHVVFVLATTEVHKLPATILSRCQRFDFRRIPPKDIAARLKYVAQHENINLDDDAAMLISVVADGALRDALSLLDRCMGVSSSITAQLVRTTAGLAGREHLYEITQSILQGSSQNVLKILERLYSDGKDMARLAQEIISHYRNIMLTKTMDNSTALVILSQEETQQISEQCKQMTLEQIVYAMDVLQLAIDHMGRGGDKRTELELALIKLCTPQLDDTIPALAARIAELERIVKQQPIQQAVPQPETPLQTAHATTPQPPVQSPLPQPNLQPDRVVQKPLENELPPLPNTEQPYSGTQPAEPQKEADLPQPQQPNTAVAQTQSLQEIIESAAPMTNWNEVLEVIKTYSKTIAAAFKNTTAYISGDYLLIDSTTDIPFRLLKQSAQRDKMRTAIKEVTGRVYRLGPYRNKEQEEKAEDPLTNFAQKLKDSGIEVKNTDNNKN